MSFVQADPIRAPARAQDLILRHRVRSYRAGDLERAYPSLPLEEDVLYAYGFMTRGTHQLLHPRTGPALSALERKVLAFVKSQPETHPSALEQALGRRRVVNGWGGFSKATTRTLERLHYRGVLRVSRRERGIRIYALSPEPAETIPRPERLRRLILTMAAILSPVPEKTLRANIARYRRLGNPREALAALLKRGEIERATIEGLSYLRLPLPARAEAGGGDEVRFLAPFDPVVWDRLRFEHLWGWAYRFEAYTPPAKRVRGYYALPLLWRDRVVGWANAEIEKGRLKVSVGFAQTRPRDKAFKAALEAEIAKLEWFLGTDQS
jgi:uncharacterized protein YcaQ